MFGFSKGGSLRKATAKEDDFDFDFDGFDESMMDADHMGDGMSDDFAQAKADRGPVLNATREVALGITDAAFSKTGREAFLKKVLPASYGETYDNLSMVKDDASIAIQEAMQEFNGTKRRVQGLFRRMAPMAEEKGMAKLSALFNKMGGQAEEDGENEQQTEQARREQLIQGTLGELFKLQHQAGEQREAIRTKREQNKEVLETYRAERNFKTMASSDSALRRLVLFNESNTFNFYRKSIELQMRQLQVQGDIYHNQSVSNVQFLKALNDIKLNTGLPDAVKLRNSELFGQEAKKNAMRGAQKLFTGSDFWQSLSQAVQGRIRSAVGSPMEMFNEFFLDSAEEVMDSQEEMAEMGGSSFTRMAVGMGGDSLLKMLGSRLRKSLRWRMKGNKHYDRIEGFGEKLREFNGNPGPILLAALANPELFGKWGKWNRKNADGSVTEEANPVTEWIRNLLWGFANEAVNNGKTVHTGIKEARWTDFSSAAGQRDLMTKTINVAIPSYLSRILREITRIRTGKLDVPAYVFNARTGAMVTKQALENDMLESLAREGNESGIKDWGASVGEELGLWERNLYNPDKKDFKHGFNERDLEVITRIAINASAKGEAINSKWLTNPANFSALGKEKAAIFTKLMANKFNDTIEGSDLDVVGPWIRRFVESKDLLLFNGETTQGIHAAMGGNNFLAGASFIKEDGSVDKDEFVKWVTSKEINRKETETNIYGDNHLSTFKQLTDPKRLASNVQLPASLRKMGTMAGQQNLASINAENQARTRIEQKERSTEYWRNYFWTQFRWDYDGSMEPDAFRKHMRKEIARQRLQDEELINEELRRQGYEPNPFTAMPVGGWGRARENALRKPMAGTFGPDRKLFENRFNVSANRPPLDNDPARNTELERAAQRLKELGSYAKGGYTGDAENQETAEEEVAGVVHKEEYVLNQEDVQKLGGVSAIERILSMADKDLQEMTRQRAISGQNQGKTTGLHAIAENTALANQWLASMAGKLDILQTVALMQASDIVQDADPSIRKRLFGFSMEFLRNRRMNAMAEAASGKQVPAYKMKRLSEWNIKDAALFGKNTALFGLSAGWSVATAPVKMMYGMAKGLKARVDRYRQPDVYTKRDFDQVMEGVTPSPSLLGEEIRKGKYLDIKSNKTIESIEDITGPVAYITHPDKLLITQEDFDVGLLNYDGQPLRLLGIKEGVKGAIGFAVNQKAKIGDFIYGKWTDNKDKLKGKLTDVYIKGVKDPVLKAKDLAAGKYHVITTEGKKIVITKWEDIKGNIYDEEGNLVLSWEEFENSLIRTGNRLMETKTMSWFKNNAKTIGKWAAIGIGTMAFGPAVPALMALRWADKKFDLRGKAKDKLNQWTQPDVYIKDKEPKEPILKGRDVARGIYLDINTNKPITSVEDITGPVADVNNPEQLVITQEDYEKGLVDVWGNPIAKSTIVSRGLSNIASTIGKAYRVARSTVSTAWRIIKVPFQGIWNRAGGLLKSLGNTFMSAYDGMKTMITSPFSAQVAQVNMQYETNMYLHAILGTLNNRLKKIRGKETFDLPSPTSPGAFGIRTKEEIEEAKREKEALKKQQEEQKQAEKKEEQKEENAARSGDHSGDGLRDNGMWANIKERGERVKEKARELKQKVMNKQLAKDIADGINKKLTGDKKEEGFFSKVFGWLGDKIGTLGTMFLGGLKTVGSWLATALGGLLGGKVLNFAKKIPGVGKLAGLLGLGKGAVDAAAGANGAGAIMGKAIAATAGTAGTAAATGGISAGAVGGAGAAAAAAAAAKSGGIKGFMKRGLFGDKIASKGKSFLGRNVGRFGRFLGGTGMLMSAASAVGNVANGNYADAASDIGMALMSTFTPWGLAAGGIIVAGSFAYKWWKKNKADRLNDTVLARMMAYGFAPKKANDTEFQKIRQFEHVLEDAVVFQNSVARLDENKIKMSDIREIFELEEGDDEHLNNFREWFDHRFSKVFIRSMEVMKIIDPSKNLEDAYDLDGVNLVRYLGAIRVSPEQMDVQASPFKHMPVLPVTASMAAAAIDSLLAKCKRKMKPEDYASGIASAKLTSNHLDDQASAVKNREIGVGQARNIGKGLKQPEMISSFTGAIHQGGAPDTINSSNNIEAIDAGGTAFEDIKFLAYGLKNVNQQDMVVALRKVEDMVKPHIASSGGKVNFSGSINDITVKVAGMFGASEDSPGSLTIVANYLRYRFIPVYVNLVTATQTYLKSMDINKGLRAKPEDQLAIIASYVNTTVQAPDGSLQMFWNYAVTPWAGDDRLNTERASINPLIERIRQRVKDEKAANAYRGLAAGDTKINVPKDKPKFGIAVAAKYGLEYDGNGAGNNALTEKGAQNLGSIMGKQISEYMKTHQMNAPANSGTPQVGSYQASVNNTGDYQSSAFGGELTTKGIGGTISAVPQPTGKGWQANRETILAAAKIVGVDPGLMAAMAAQESGFDPFVKAGTSSATGLFQFINSTWRATLSKYGARYGIPMNTPPTNGAANALMGAHFIKDNIDGLRSMGMQVQPGDAYLAHFMGLGGARRVIRADQNAMFRTLFPKEARANKAYADLTIGQLRAKLTSNMMAKHRQFGVDVPIGGGMTTTSANTSTGNAPNAVGAKSTTPAKQQVTVAEYRKQIAGIQQAKQTTLDNLKAGKITKKQADLAIKQYDKTANDLAMKSAIKDADKEKYIDTKQDTNSNTAVGGAFNADSRAARAADYATQGAEKGSVGRCAKYVRIALEKAGFQRPPGEIGSAYMYANGPLSALGFVQMPDPRGPYQKGDILVFGKVPNGPHGHIQIYNGQDWVSDFVQNGGSRMRPFCSPAAKYNATTPTLWRHPETGTADGTLTSNAGGVAGGSAEQAKQKVAVKFRSKAISFNEAAAEWKNANAQYAGFVKKQLDKGGYKDTMVDTEANAKQTMKVAGKLGKKAQAVDELLRNRQGLTKTNGIGDLSKLTEKVSPETANLLKKAGIKISSADIVKTPLERTKKEREELLKKVNGATEPATKVAKAVQRALDVKNPATKISLEDMAKSQHTKAKTEAQARDNVALQLAELKAQTTIMREHSNLLKEIRDEVRRKKSSDRSPSDRVSYRDAVDRRASKVSDSVVNLRKGSA